ncbi:MAG: alkaline phosphatase family protein [Paraprevotella sp.]|nr:alkaline phosphatase family protein [Paraprevotella sp.]
MRSKIANKFRGLLWLLCGLCTACTVYDTPADIAGGPEEVVGAGDGIIRYVLWVYIDGARGSIVKDEVEKGNLPVLKPMLEHSKYAWTGLSDDHALLSDSRGNFSDEDPVTWASMLTGLNSRMHRIRDYSYTPDYAVGGAPVVPNTIMQYLSNSDPTLRMSCVSSWENLNRYVGVMQSVVTTKSDAETVDTLADQLARDDYRFTLAAFRSVQDAGKQGGFKETNAQYVDGLKQADTYLGRLLEVIKTRENAANEDWLICVTSDHGGTEDGHYGGASDEERDFFGIFYYDHYTPLELKGETFYAVRFSATEWATAEDSTALYGIGRDKQLSVEMNIRNTPTETQSYHGPNWTYLVGKAHWGMYRQRETAVLRVAENGTLQEAVTGCNDARWHSLYMGLGPQSATAGQRMYLISYDGRRQKYSETSAMGVEDDSTAVVIGKGAWKNYSSSTG